MKTRKEIEDEVIKPSRDHGELNAVDSCQIELLLDIRELLEKILIRT